MPLRLLSRRSARRGAGRVRRQRRLAAADRPPRRTLDDGGDDERPGRRDPCHRRRALAAAARSDGAGSEGRADARAGRAPAVPRARPSRRLRERHTRPRAGRNRHRHQRTRPWRASISTAARSAGACRRSARRRASRRCTRTTRAASSTRSRPRPTPNVLGQFFTQWDVALDANCVGGYCKPADSDRLLHRRQGVDRRSDRDRAGRRPRDRDRDRHAAGDRPVDLRPVRRLTMADPAGRRRAARRRDHPARHRAVLHAAGIDARSFSPRELDSLTRTLIVATRRGRQAGPWPEGDPL